MTDAVLDGFDEVQHASFWFMNFFGPAMNAEPDAVLRFRALGNRAKDIDLNSPEVRAFIALLRSKNIVVDPTLSRFDQLLRVRGGEVSPAMSIVIDRLPLLAEMRATAGGIARDDTEHATYSTSYRAMTVLLKKMFEAGIRIVPGTDSGDGFEYTHELEIYVGAGLPAADVLHLATLGAASVMKREGQLGSIESGKMADLVLLRNDPSVDIRNVRDIAMVIKDGNIYAPAALTGLVSVLPRADRVQ
jgi:imidazolonepropionase-like amidohydrolase